jgi:hypothetical protein
VASLADEIGNDPVLLPLLDRLEAQGQQLGSAEAASNQHREHRVIAQLAHGRPRGAFKKPATLLGRQPVADAHVEPAHAFHPTDTGRQLGAEKTRVGCLVRRDAPDGGHPTADRCRRIAPLIKVNPVSPHDVRLNAKRGSEQYHATNSRMA